MALKPGRPAAHTNPADTERSRRIHERRFTAPEVPQSSAERSAEYAELLAAIPSNASDSAAARALLCRWHADENRFAEASALLDAIKPSSAVWFLEASVHLALYAARDQERIDAAFAAWAACGVPLISPAIAYGLHTYYYNCSSARLRDCLTKLEPLG